MKVGASSLDNGEALKIIYNAKKYPIYDGVIYMRLRMSEDRHVCFIKILFLDEEALRLPLGCKAHDSFLDHV